MPGVLQLMATRKEKDHKENAVQDVGRNGAVRAHYSPRAMNKHKICGTARLLILRSFFDKAETGRIKPRDEILLMGLVFPWLAISLQSLLKDWQYKWCTVTSSTSSWLSVLTIHDRRDLGQKSRRI